MSQAVFHLGVTEADLNGATLAIIPGDPARVQKNRRTNGKSSISSKPS
ncbi:uridine phosphorylase [Vibrio sp. JCM 19053]|nr:uridine phosphorylase [Vibrio sp. JCM 19053]